MLDLKKQLYIIQNSLELKIYFYINKRNGFISKKIIEIDREKFKNVLKVIKHIKKLILNKFKRRFYSILYTINSMFLVSIHFDKTCFLHLKLLGISWRMLKVAIAI